MKTVMAFGVFDGLHDGHRHFLREARKLGEHLTVAVAHDEVVFELKKHAPRYSGVERLRALVSEGLADRVSVGDREPGVWNIVEEVRPDIIALGYDQKEIRKHLEKIRAKFNFIIVIVSAHEPERLHSRILNRSQKV